MARCRWVKGSYIEKEDYYTYVLKGIVDLGERIIRGERSGQWLGMLVICAHGNKMESFSLSLHLFLVRMYLFYSRKWALSLLFLPF